MLSNLLYKKLCIIIDTLNDCASIWGRNSTERYIMNNEEYAEVITNDLGDFEVVINKVRVERGYFSRMRDYAKTDAHKLACKLNNA